MNWAILVLKSYYPIFFVFSYILQYIVFQILIWVFKFSDADFLNWVSFRKIWQILIKWWTKGTFWKLLLSIRSVTSMMPATCFSSLRSISTLLYFSGLVPNLTMPSLCEIFAKISPLSTMETKYFSASFEFSRPALEATSSKLKVRKVLVNLKIYKILFRVRINNNNKQSWIDKLKFAEFWRKKN